MRDRPATNQSRLAAGAPLRWLILMAACLLALAAGRALLAPAPRVREHPAPHALMYERRALLPKRSLPRRQLPGPLRLQPVRLIDAFCLPKPSATVGALANTSSPLAPLRPEFGALVLLPLLLAPAVRARIFARPRAPPLRMRPA